MGWPQTIAIFAFSAIFWCLICVCDGVGKSTQDVEQVIERSLYNQNGLENVEPYVLIRNTRSNNKENEGTVQRRIIFHHRQKRGGSHQGNKNSGGGIWKKISRGIQQFTNHIRRTKQKIIRIIKGFTLTGPSYSKSKPHRKWKPMGADSSSLSVNATAGFAIGNKRISGI